MDVHLAPRRRVVAVGVGRIDRRVRADDGREVVRHRQLRRRRAARIDEDLVSVRLGILLVQIRLHLRREDAVIEARRRDLTRRVRLADGRIFAEKEAIADVTGIGDEDHAVLVAVLRVVGAERAVQQRRIVDRRVALVAVDHAIREEAVARAVSAHGRPVAALKDAVVEEADTVVAAVEAPAAAPRDAVRNHAVGHGRQRLDRAEFGQHTAAMEVVSVVEHRRADVRAPARQREARQPRPLRQRDAADGVRTASLVRRIRRRIVRADDEGRFRPRADDRHVLRHDGARLVRVGVRGDIAEAPRLRHRLVVVDAGLDANRRKLARRHRIDRSPETRIRRRLRAVWCGGGRGAIHGEDGLVERRLERERLPGGRRHQDERAVWLREAAPRVRTRRGKRVESLQRRRLRRLRRIVRDGDDRAALHRADVAEILRRAKSHPVERIESVCRR